MLSETFKKAFSNGGLKAGGIVFLAEVVLAIIGFVIMGSTIIMPLVRAGMTNFGSDVTSLPVDLISDLIGNAGLLLLYSLIAVVLNVVIFAGLLGSFQDAVVRGVVTLRGFWENAKRYFLSYLGYGLLFGVLFLFASAIIMSVLAFIPFLGPILGQVICTILLMAGVVPLVVLSVIKKSERRGFINDNLKIMLVCGLIVGVLAYVPLLGWLAAAVIQIFYPLYILCLYHDQHPELVDGGEPV